MFDVESDKSKQLLSISYSGRVGADEMPFCVDKIKNTLADMQPGFRLLADFSKMELMDYACGIYVKEIMGLCNARGVSAVTRVFPDAKKDIGLYIMSCFHYSRDVHIMTYENLELAMQSLVA